MKLRGLWLLNPQKVEVQKCNIQDNIYLLLTYVILGGLLDVVIPNCLHFDVTPQTFHCVIFRWKENFKLLRAILFSFFFYKCRCSLYICVLDFTPLWQWKLLKYLNYITWMGEWKHWQNVEFWACFQFPVGYQQMNCPHISASPCYVSCVFAFNKAFKPPLSSWSGPTARKQNPAGRQVAQVEMMRWSTNWALGSRSTGKVHITVQSRGLRHSNREHHSSVTLSLFIPSFLHAGIHSCQHSYIDTHKIAERLSLVLSSTNLNGDGGENIACLWI